jgi:hypothetical protein
VLAGQVPYRDFAVEYPPGSLALFTLPAVAGNYFTWYRVENALGWGAVIVLCGLLLPVVRPGRREQAALLGLVALVPLLLGPFSLMRFDPWPTAFVLAALAALLRRHPTWALALIGVGTVVKTWPILLVPLLLVHGVPRRALAACAAIVVLAWAPFVMMDRGGPYNSVMTQVNRHLEFESVAASALFALGLPVRTYFETGSFSVSGSGADELATLSSALQLGVILLVAFLYARSRRGPRELLTAAAATVAAIAVLGKVLSPQYLLWLAPFVALADLAAIVFFVAACLATRGLQLGPFRELSALHAAPVALLAVRNALLLVTTGAMLRLTLRR